MIDWQHEFKFAAFIFAMLSTVAWFASAAAAAPPVGHWGDSPIVKEWRQKAPLVAYVNAMAALLTGLSVVCGAIADQFWGAAL